eukprot:638005-Hanusia_phi.AAC.3
MFWARYFFGAKAIADEEARKHKLLSAAQLFDDEDFKWDEEETAFSSCEAASAAKKSDAADHQEDAAKIKTETVEGYPTCEDKEDKVQQPAAADMKGSPDTFQAASESQDENKTEPVQADESVESASSTSLKESSRDAIDSDESNKDVQVQSLINVQFHVTLEKHDDNSSPNLGKSASPCVDGTCSAIGSDESSGSTVFVHDEIEEPRREEKAAKVTETTEKDEKDDDWADWE